MGLVRLAKMTGFREDVKLVEEVIMTGPGFMMMSLVMACLMSLRMYEVFWYLRS